VQHKVGITAHRKNITRDHNIPNILKLIHIKLYHCISFLSTFFLELIAYDIQLFKTNDNGNNNDTSDEFSITEAWAKRPTT